MIALRVRVPFASWRKPHARELLETETLPSPATCYGALLSLVGETDRVRHVGARVSVGLFNQPVVSTVLRTLWRIKDTHAGQGNGMNARPDLQQLVIDSDVLLICDSREERDPSSGLEFRVLRAMRAPHEIERFGGWCLGESTHLINDVWLLAGEVLPRRCEVFVLDPGGAVTLPVWVDHVGSRGTRYAVGRIEPRTSLPANFELPLVGFE